MNNSSPSPVTDSGATGLRLSAAASLLGVLLLASIGAALVMEEGEKESAHVLPTLIVQRVLTVTPVVPVMDANPDRAILPLLDQAAEEAVPASRSAVTSGKAESPAKEQLREAHSVVVEGPEEVWPAELPQTMLDEPRRSGGGGGTPLGYDVWSPLLDGSLGIREAADRDAEVARTPQPRRGLRPFSDANHG